MADEEIVETVQQQKTCAFFVKRKNRFCKMHVGKGKRYCGEHILAAGEESGRKRIPCPLDPNHTVYEDQLSKHLKRCNKTKKTQVVYYEANINSGIENYCPFPDEKILLSSVPKEKLEIFIEKVNRLYSEHCSTPEKCVLIDETLRNELNCVKAGSTVLKHLHQQASLIGQLRQQGLLQPDTVFVEFGAGRGMLSHWLQKSLPECKNNDFLLVDRASNRYKFDSYHKGEHQGPSFKRLNLDIEHLNLGKVPCIAEQSRNIVAASKHLCGAATDLSLRCLLETTITRECHVCSDGVVSNETSSTGQSQAKRKRTSTELHTSHVAGLVFALCCHHRCNWPHYVGREFMAKLGLGPAEFHLLCCLSSWATCGMGLRQTTEELTKDRCSSQSEDHEEARNDTVVHDEPTIDREGSTKSRVDRDESIIDESYAKCSQLTTEEREEIGRRCKRLIDAGRVSYLKSYGFKAVLKNYVDSSVSLENIALVAVPQDK